MLAAWLILKRFWYVAPIVALAFAVLFMRADMADKDTKLAVASAANADLTKSNKDAASTIAAFRAQRVDNDAIANSVASKIKINTTNETTYKTTTQRISANDPAVANWRAVAVPASVRGALSSDRPDSAAR